MIKTNSVYLLTLNAPGKARDPVGRGGAGRQGVRVLESGLSLRTQRGVSDGRVRLCACFLVYVGKCD